MKAVHTVLIAVLASAAFSLSCTKEINKEEAQPEKEVIYGRITATVTLPQETKVSYSEVDASGKNQGLKSVWEAGDYFYATNDEGNTFQFNIESGVGTATAVFSADVYGNIDGSTIWKAVLGANATLSSNVLYAEYDGQDGSIGNLADFDYISVSGTGTSPAFAFGDVSKAERLSYILRIKLPAGVRHIEYCTANHWKLTYSSNIIINDGDFDDVSMIDLGAESNAGDYCYLAIPATQYGNYITEIAKGVIITFLNEAKTKSNGKVLSSNLTGQGGKVGLFDVSTMNLIDRPLKTDAISFGSVNVIMKKDDAASPITSYDNFEDYYRSASVAPSWAPFNLGANISNPAVPADLYGDCFCWGETAPRTTFSPEIYTYDGTHTVGSFPNFSSTQLGAMNTYGVTNGASNGIIKLQQIAGTKYDAARVRWGVEWRMPTEEEWMMFTGSSTSLSNLSNPCTTASGFTTADKTITYYTKTVRGREFSKGGVSVFFPYGGRYGPGYAYYGVRGFYWSDTRVRATPSNGNLTNSPLRITMTPSNMDYASEPVHFGLPIRPVVNEPKLSDSAKTPSVLEDGGSTGETLILPNSNLYGTITDGDGNPIPGVAVSDGYSYCSTDINGVYQMSANTQARTVNVTIPAAYEIPLGSDGRPAFFQPIDLTEGKKAEKDFTLIARPSIPSRFTIIGVADAHVKDAVVNGTSENINVRFTTAMEDVQETVTALGTEIPVGPGGESAGEIIGIALGDQLWDEFSSTTYNNIKSKFNTLTNKAGKTVPFFYCIGNHDHDNNGTSDYTSENAFVNNFGPTNYSFDMGNAHIIVMDNVIYTGSGSGTISYNTGFTQAQIEWLNADIAKVTGKSNKIVVLCVHVALSKSSGGDAGTQNAVMGALKNNFKNVHVFSGHDHVNNNNLYKGWTALSGRSIYEHTLQAFCGYWWMADISYTTGCPAGYGVFTFDNDDIYAEYNKVTKEAPGFQMRVYNGGDTYNKNTPWEEWMYGGSRGYKEYNWDNSVKNKYVVRIWDSGSTNDTQDYWTVKLNGTPLTRVSTPIQDAAAASYVFNDIKGVYGDANNTTDQIWYSDVNFNSTFVITATHTMKSGWSATYTTTNKYVGTNYNGFAYGQVH